MYVTSNPKTKKAAKEILSHDLYAADLLIPQGLETLPHNGEVTIEGPHYPEPHRWYGTATIRNGVVVKVS